MSVEPPDVQRRQLADLAYRLDQARQERDRSPRREWPAIDADIATFLARLSRWMDANPTLRLDMTRSLDTPPIAILLAISRHPASIPLYRKMMERQPELRTKAFDTWTLDANIAEEAKDAKREGDSAGRGVLQQKLNPGRAEMVKMDRLFGKVGDDRKTNPLPRDVQLLIREQLTGIPIDKQKASKTKTAGRRKHRKTKRATRKTKRFY